MKTAYQEEIDKVQLSLDKTKTELEAWYARRYEDKDLVGAVKDTYDQLLAKADNEITAFNGTVKSIRSAVVA